jgi:lipooligosaccharide transport system permease protein
VAAVPHALHVVEYNAIVFRRLWRGNIMVSFFTPLFFLTAMGLGLGTLVNRGSGGVHGVPYLDFIAPGLIACATMQTASVEAMYPILARIMWDRMYDAMLATPVAVRDLVVGEVTWFALRLLMVSTIFWVVMELFGVGHFPGSLLVIPMATLTGLAFATPVMAFTTTRRNDNGFAAIQRFVITPLYLFGGAFFPIAQLPLVLQWVAWVTPLAHGVALCRGVVLGNLGVAEAFGHLLILLVYIAAGLVLTYVLLRRRLLK